VPAGWQRIGKDTAADLLPVSPCARRFVRTWYQAGLRTRIMGVRKDVPVTVRFKAREYRCP
jgi:hypothetical protein